MVCEVKAPFEFTLACSSRFRSKKGVFFLPVVTDGTTLTLEGRAIPEFQLLPEGLQECFLEVISFAKRQYRSNFQLPFTLKEFQHLEEELRRTLSFPDAFKIACGVRLGMNRFLRVDDSSFRSGCIVRFGEEDSILIRASVHEALVELGLSYKTIPVEIGGDQRGWKEIIPDFIDIRLHESLQSDSFFVKDVVHQKVFLNISDDHVREEVKKLLYPLQVETQKWNGT